MVKVLLNNVVLADSPSPVILEGNYYFPPDSVSKVNLKNSGTTTVCPWKGTASYYSADVNGKAVKDVAWQAVKLHPVVPDSYGFHPGITPSPVPREPTSRITLLSTR
ncbi:hypothetical protein JVT61DRAFT_7317 [Boletus reticuloceps]|uniref:DUF427 domain-containing protein n=1 Tax=Boletus reticuloceps TaxID=495285 RepID=A0A8I2YJF7_9AGAM|nr:hypothetical protein JVT61DRAFT_7317 [Boletus reticuloceps]